MSTIPSREAIIQAIENKKTTFISDDKSFIDLIAPSQKRYEQLEYFEYNRNITLPTDNRNITLPTDDKNEKSLKAFEKMAPHLQFFYLDASVDLLNSKFETVQSIVKNKKSPSDYQNDIFAILGLGDDFIREFQSVGIFIDMEASDFQSDTPKIKIAYSDFMHLSLGNAKDVLSRVINTTQSTIHRIVDITNESNSHLYTNGNERVSLLKNTALQSNRLAKVFPHYLNLKNKPRIGSDLKGMPISGEAYDLNIQQSPKKPNNFAITGRFAYMLLNYVWDNYKLIFDEESEGFQLQKSDNESKTPIDNIIESTFGTNYEPDLMNLIRTWDADDAILGRICHKFHFDKNWFGIRPEMYDSQFARWYRAEDQFSDNIGRKIVSEKNNTASSFVLVQYLLAQYMCREKVELPAQNDDKTFKFSINDEETQNRKYLQLKPGAVDTFRDTEKIKAQLKVYGDNAPLRFLQFKLKSKIDNDYDSIIHSDNRALDNFLAQIYATSASDVTLFTTDDGVYSMSLNEKNNQKPIIIRKY